MDSQNNKVEIGADKVKVYGPKVDGGYNITIETGEYSQQDIAKLMAIIKSGIPTRVTFVVDKRDILS